MRACTELGGAAGGGNALVWKELNDSRGKKLLSGGGGRVEVGAGLTGR